MASSVSDFSSSMQFQAPRSPNQPKFTEQPPKVAMAVTAATFGFSKNHLPLPDPSAFESKSPEEASANPVESLFTPPRLPDQPFVFSPSIKASPQAPAPVHDYHHAQELLETVKKRDLRYFDRRPIHTVLGSPSKAKVLEDPTVAAYVSKCSQHLKRNKDEASPPPLEASPQFKVKVSAPDEIVVEDTRSGAQQEFSIHRQETPTGEKRKRFFPRGGDGAIIFKKGEAASPGKIPKIVAKFRTSSTNVSPMDYLQQEIEQLTAPKTT